MRIEMRVGDRRQAIDTADPDLAARWLWEHVVPLMKVNYSMPPAYLEVWPSSPEEEKAIGRVNSNLSRVTLLKLAETILKALPEEATGG